MEKFKHRIKFYAVGFIIGLIIMFMIFGNRGCSWLPGNRVKNMIAEKEILAGDSILNLMTCAGITNKDIYDILNENGDVDFSKSKTDVEPKRYVFTATKDDSPLEVEFALFDSTAEILDFDFKTKSACQINISNSHKNIVAIPDEEVRKIIESNELRILNMAQCQLKCLQLNEKDVLSFHSHASFDALKSRPRLESNPEYVMTGQINGTTYFITYIIGDKRSRISNIQPNNCNCSE